MGSECSIKQNQTLFCIFRKVRKLPDTLFGCNNHAFTQERRKHEMNKDVAWKVLKGIGTVIVTIVMVIVEVIQEMLNKKKGGI
jgi:hypothetical protein